MSQLSAEIQQYLSLREALKAEFAEIDDETLEDTLEGLSDVRAIIGEVARSCISDDTMAAALRRRIDEMRERLARIEVGHERKRELALLALRQIGLTKLVEPAFTVSVRNGAPAVEIVDETAIPQGFWLPQDPKLNKGALYQALKTGAAVPGAAMSPGDPVLAIRRS